MKLNKIIQEIEEVKASLEKWNRSEDIPAIELDITLRSLQQTYAQLARYGAQRYVNEQLDELAETAIEQTDHQSVEHHDDDEGTAIDQVFMHSQIQASDDSLHETESIDEPCESTDDQENQYAHIDAVLDHESTNELPDQDSAAIPKPMVAATPELFGEPVTYTLIDTFVRELFKGDRYRYDDEISKLSQLNSFEDALIYISQNYDWPAQSPIVDRFIDLLSGQLSSKC